MPNKDLDKHKASFGPAIASLRRGLKHQDRLTMQSSGKLAPLAGIYSTLISFESAGKEITMPSSVIRAPSGKPPLNAAIAMAFLGAGTR